MLNMCTYTEFYTMSKNIYKNPMHKKRILCIEFTQSYSFNYFWAFNHVWKFKKNKNHWTIIKNFEKPKRNAY